MAISAVAKRLLGAYLTALVGNLMVTHVFLSHPAATILSGFSLLDGEGDPPGERGPRLSRRWAMRDAIDFSVGSVCHEAIVRSSGVPIWALGNKQLAKGKWFVPRAQKHRGISQ